MIHLTPYMATLGTTDLPLQVTARGILLIPGDVEFKYNEPANNNNNNNRSTAIKNILSVFP